ncbi:FUSC family protein, partial [Enterococcus gallinarum]|uniref:FUSC family protein n=1 Tax=Enterococcus gallinarum TaxID=1353 RepID=UPI003D120D50
AVIAPFLLLVGSLLARPSRAQFALGAVVGFINTAGFAATYQSSFQNFINGAIAGIAAVGVGVIIVDTFQVTGAELALARMFRAAFRDIAARA